MISFIKSSFTVTIARTTSSVAPILRPHQTPSSASFRFSSCIQQRKRSPNNILRIDRNSAKSSVFRPSRSIDERMGSDNITDIEEIHRDAILDKQSTYIDPTTGFTVFTELAHLKRGKCCGNQCRHCPYGWSNVRSENGGFIAAESNARAFSGDREGTARMVKRILDGTYYEREEHTKDQGIQRPSKILDCDANKSAQYNETNNTTKPVPKGQGKGGSGGGTLTTKNVPYTRKGDAGTSQLFTGERRNKDDVLFEALGTVDELCSIAGVVYAELMASKEKIQSENYLKDTTIGSRNGNNGIYGDLPEQLLEVMSRLFDVGSHIATPPNPQKKQSTNGNRVNDFSSHHTSLLEEWIDTMTEELPELTSFILPTGSPASAQLHVARTVCRRAERRMVPLVQEEETVDPAALSYVNRLSDYFFTAARYVNYCEDTEEVQYRREGKGGLNDKGETKGTKSLQRERVVVKLKK